MTLKVVTDEYENRLLKIRKAEKKQTRCHKHENCKGEKSIPRKKKISETNLTKNFRELLGKKKSVLQHV